MNAGWNLISINVYPTQDLYALDEDRGPDIRLMMSQLRIDEGLHRVFLMKDETGAFYAPHIRDYNAIPYWNLEQGYDVKIRQNMDTVAVWQGDRIPWDAPISIEPGWNIIAYFPTYELSMSVNSENPEDIDDEENFYAIREIKHQFVILKDGFGNYAYSSRDRIFSNMPNLRPGQAYEININTNVEVIFHWSPFDNELGQRQEEGAPVEEDMHWPSPIPTGSNMSLLVESIEGYRPTIETS